MFFIVACTRCSGELCLRCVCGALLQIYHTFSAVIEPEYFRIGEWRDTASQLLTDLALLNKPMDFDGDVSR